MVTVCASSALARLRPRDPPISRSSALIGAPTILSLAIANNQDRTNLFTVELRRDGNMDGYGPDQVSSLEAIGQYLHACLLPSTSSNSSNSASNAFSLNRSVDSLEQTDKSPLRMHVCSA